MTVDRQHTLYKSFIEYNKALEKEQQKMKEMEARADAENKKKIAAANKTIRNPIPNSSSNNNSGLINLANAQDELEELLEGD